MYIYIYIYIYSFEIEKDCCRNVFKLKMTVYSVLINIYIYIYIKLHNRIYSNILKYNYIFMYSKCNVDLY